MRTVAERAFAITVDAVVIGCGGAALYWVLWHPSVRAAAIIGLVGGPGTSGLMRLQRRRRQTLGDRIAARLFS